MSVMDTKKVLQQKHVRDQGLELARRAGMDEFAYNTGVVYSSDSTFRVGISSGMSPWGDHVCIGTMAEKEGNRSWYFAHVSPAQARLIAHHLLVRADQMECKS